MNDQTKTPFRLALRKEGDYWNAYIAPKETMEGAHLLGSALIGPLQVNPELKEAFQMLMMRVMAQTIKDAFNMEVESWDEVKPAPADEITKEV